MTQISLRREPRSFGMAGNGKEEREDKGEEEEEEEEEEDFDGGSNRENSLRSFSGERGEGLRSSSRSDYSSSTRGGGGGGGGGGSVYSESKDRSERSQQHVRASDSFSQASSHRSSASRMSNRSGRSGGSAREENQGQRGGRERRGGARKQSSHEAAYTLTAADRCLLHFSYFGKLAARMQDLPDVLIELEVPLAPADEQWLLMELERRMEMCDDETSSSVTEGFISDTSSLAGSTGGSDGSMEGMQRGRRGEGGGKTDVGIEDFLLGRWKPQVVLGRVGRGTGRTRMSGILCVRRRKGGVPVWRRRFFVLTDKLELLSFRSRRRFVEREPPEAKRIIAGNRVGSMPSSFQQRHSFFLSRQAEEEGGGGGEMLVLSAPSEAARRAWIDQIAQLATEETIHLGRMWEEEGEAPDASAATLVAFLLDLNADVNCQNKRGCSALHFAAQNGDVASCHALLLASAGLR
eukprot:755103-Hanusia_phi.AAC.1